MGHFSAMLTRRELGLVGAALCGCVAHARPTSPGASAKLAGGAAMPVRAGGAIRSLVFVEPGRVEWRERPRPRVEGTGEAVVRPVAATTCDLDQLILAGRTPYRGPFAIGHECVAEVVEVGDGVRSLAPGDLVSVAYHMNCGTCDRCARGLTANCRRFPTRACYGLPLGGDWGGLFDDLVRVPAADGMLTKLPAGVDPVAAVSASDNLSIGWEVIAGHLRDAPNARVLVVGGSQSIGLYAADFARALGAREVVYADTSARRLEIAAALGATPHVGRLTDALGTFDLSVDASVDPRGLRAALTCLEPEATCESVGIYFEDVPFPTLAMYARSVRFRTARGNARAAAPHALRAIADGAVRPQLVNSAVLPWEEVTTALGASDKPVFTRPRVAEA